MATNQPIPFKEHSSGARKDGEDPQVPGKPATGEARPPGEVGGHTVQPWEQDRPALAASTPSATSSKDVPPPQQGAAEARAPGGGPGMTTTAAPYNKPSAKEAEPAKEPADAALAKAGVDGEGEDDEGDGVAAEHAGARELRPNRPPVYSPQQGHEPAPRPPPSHAPPAPLTEGDRLVEAITKAIAENIGKAFHQSVAQAVRDVLPLSGRSVDQGKPAGGNGSSVRVAPAPSGMGKAGTPSRPPVPAPKAAPAAAKPQESKPAPKADPSAQGQLGGPRPSQYGGTIEAPDQDAIERAKRADGGPAAEKADEAKRDGSLA